MHQITRVLEDISGTHAVQNLTDEEAAGKLADLKAFMEASLGRRLSFLDIVEDDSDLGIMVRLVNLSTLSQACETSKAKLAWAFPKDP
eukprot:3386099-Alexandrium_andersonii.AAC.1